MKNKKFDELLIKIKNKDAKIGVIGLGYVGLPLAILFAKHGYPVTGFIRNEKKLQDLQSGKNPISDSTVDEDLKKVIGDKLQVNIISNDSISNQDIFIICVPTPVSEDKIPDLADLKSVALRLSKIDLLGKLIVNESTVAPFTTREVFGNFNGDYFLACSPERIDPGNKSKNTENIPKVIGGKDNRSLELLEILYQQILKTEVVKVSSLEAAEMAKMLENTYRAVNIGLINEFAKLADECKIDILEVIKAASTKWSFHAHYPGIGVGGHCIPVDPYYILELAKKKNVLMPIVEKGLHENEGMPKFVMGKVLKNYKKGMSVLVYGITYKRDVADLRESPVTVFCRKLAEKNIPFCVYDPFFEKKDIKSMGFEPGSVKKVDMLIIGTNHSSLLKDYVEIIGDNTIVIDGRNYFVQKVGIAVYGVGRTLV